MGKDVAPEFEYNVYSMLKHRDKEYNINHFFEILNLLINDLEIQEFNFIPKEHYKEPENIYTYKSEFTRWLKSLFEKSHTKHIKEIEYFVKNL